MKKLFSLLLIMIFIVIMTMGVFCCNNDNGYKKNKKNNCNNPTKTVTASVTVSPTETPEVTDNETVNPTDTTIDKTPIANNKVLPKTGASENIILIISGILLITIGIFVFRKVVVENCRKLNR
jgi:LPXTG-motif cell wall-anchored protein